MNKKRNIFLLLIMMAALFPDRARADLAAELATVGLEWADAKGYEIKLNRRRSGKTMTFVEMSAMGPQNSRIDIEFTKPINEERATMLASTQLKIIKSTYEDQPTPYEGEITNESSCDKKYKAVSHRLSNKWALNDLLEARTTERYTWGNCKPGSTGHRALIAFFYNRASMSLLKIILYKKELEFNFKKQEGMLKNVAFK